MKKVLRALSLALVIAMLAVTAFADSYVPSIQQKKAMGIKTVTATLEDGTEVKHPGDRCRGDPPGRWREAV